MHHWNCTAYGNGCFYQDIACGFNDFLFGCIVKLVLDKNFKEIDEPEENQEESGEEQTQEQSDSDGEKKSE